MQYLPQVDIDKFRNMWAKKASGSTRNFLWEASREAKCDSEGAKSKNLPKMADFGHFSSDGGPSGGQSLRLGVANALMPPPLMPPLLKPRY